MTSTAAENILVLLVRVQKAAVADSTGAAAAAAAADNTGAAAVVHKLHQLQVVAHRIHHTDSQQEEPDFGLILAPFPDSLQEQHLGRTRSNFLPAGYWRAPLHQELQEVATSLYLALPVCWPPCSVNLPKLVQGLWKRVALL